MHIDAICGFECMSINVSKNAIKMCPKVENESQPCHNRPLLQLKKRGGMNEQKMIHDLKIVG